MTRTPKVNVKGEEPIQRQLRTIKYWTQFRESLDRKKIAILLVIGIAAVAGNMLVHKGFVTPADVMDFLGLYPILSPLLFIIFYIFLTLLLIPTLPLNLLAGILWGSVWGGIYTLIATSIAAMIAFLIARHIAGAYFQSLFQRIIWVRFLEEAGATDWRLVAFARANPIFPTSLLNYFFGLTAISLRHYFFATIAAIAPMVFLFSYLGETVGLGIVQGGNSLIQNLLGISLAITGVVAIRIGVKMYASYRAKMKSET
jgi:uncharacterized membrane protein YdjX (TVP38/TMEM64 family)